MNNTDRKRRELVFFLLTVVILLLVLLNAYAYFIRLDITENRTFTISEVSKSLFREIPEEVSVTYFVTDKLKRFSPVPSQVEDMLHEYAAFSHGKILVSIKDPEKGDTMARVEHFGVAPQQVQIIEKNEQSMALMYSGIVIEYLNTFKTLPLVFRTDTLEYDLTLGIRNLVRNEQKSVGVLIGEDGKTLDGNYQYLKKQLSETFTVKEIGQGEDIPQGLSTLIVLGCRDIDEYELFPIDQYVMGGGKVLFAVSGVSVDAQKYFTTQKIEQAPVLDFLARNGVDVKRALLLDRYAKRIPIRQNRGSMVLQTLEWYPHWVSIIEKNTSRENPVTSRFEGLDLLWPSPLSVSDRDGLTHEIIARSSDESWLMTDYLNTNPADSKLFAVQSQQSKGRYDVAAALSGVFSSYFSDRPIPERKGEAKTWTSAVPKSPETRMLVVGNTDFLSDLIQYSDSSSNLAFLENASEWLTNDDDLLSIRTRASRDLRLNRIEDPSRKQMVLFIAEILNIYIVPGAVVIAGIIRAIRRRERSSRQPAEPAAQPTGGNS